MKAVQQSLTNTADSAEGGAVRKWLHEVFALLYTGAEQRIQRNRTWNQEDMMIANCIVMFT